MSNVKIDLSQIEKLVEVLNNADSETLQVGWFSSANYKADLPVAQVAFWQEYGTKTAPPRPFFRPAVAENQAKWASLVDSGANAVLEGRNTVNDIFNGLGLMAQADIKNAITGDHAALSPVTLALRKLRDDGHVINGTLVGAVAAAVERGETGPGQLGEPSTNQSPLRDQGIMLSSLTYNLGAVE